MLSIRARSALILIATSALSMSASAHTGTESHIHNNFLSGFAHPLFGLDQRVHGGLPGGAADGLGLRIGFQGGGRGRGHLLRKLGRYLRVGFDILQHDHGFLDVWRQGFDIHRQDWSDELLDLFGVPRALLPDVKDCAARFGETDPALFGGAIAISGIAGDQQAATIG